MVETEYDDEPFKDVVRDATFARAVADDTIVLSLGRDMEIAFLQGGSVPVRRTDEGERLRYDFKPVLTEVVRVRLTPAGCIKLAMSIIEEMIKEDRVNVPSMVRTIDGWVEESKVASAPADGEAHRLAAEQ